MSRCVRGRAAAGLQSGDGQLQVCSQGICTASRSTFFCCKASISDCITSVKCGVKKWARVRVRVRVGVEVNRTREDSMARVLRHRLRLTIGTVIIIKVKLRDIVY